MIGRETGSEKRRDCEGRGYRGRAIGVVECGRCVGIGQGRALGLCGRWAARDGGRSLRGCRGSLECSSASAREGSGATGSAYRPVDIGSPPSSNAPRRLRSRGGRAQHSRSAYPTRHVVSNAAPTALVPYTGTSSCSSKSVSSLQIPASRASAQARYSTSSGSTAPIASSARSIYW